MSGTTPALIAAAAGVGFGHAVMPDHWLPLAVVGRTRRYPLSRIARLSGAAGAAHVLVSVVLGAIVIAVGLEFRSAVRDAQNAIVGGLLVATGAAFAVLELRERGRGHERGHAHGDERGHGHAHGQEHEYEHARAHEHGHSHAHRIGSVVVPFGAAASPDLTILPVFLAAAAAGALAAIGSLLAFAAVTVGTIVGMTVLAAAGGYQIRGRWLERWSDAITAIVLVLIGALVLADLI